MASRHSSNTFPTRKHGHPSQAVAEQPVTATQNIVLSEATQKHMQLIGAFLVQIVQEWNQRHLSGENPMESSSQQESE